MSDLSKKLLDLVAAEQYERLFGVASDATLEEIHRAHIRLLYKFRGESSVVEALNGAKSAMMAESDLEKGRRLFRSGMIRDALPFLRRAAEQRGYAVDYRYLGSALVELGRHDEARGSFEHAVSLRGDAVNHYWLGSVLLYLGRYEDAMLHLEKAVAMRGEGVDRELLSTCHELLRKHRVRRAFGLGRIARALSRGWAARLVPFAATGAVCGFFLFIDPEQGALASLLLLAALAYLSYKHSSSTSLRG